MRIGRVYTDKEIISGIRLGGSHTDKFLRYVYKKNWPMVLSMILKNQGKEEDAGDIFQEAMIVFYEQVKNGSLELHCKISTYLYAVARNLWNNKLKRHKASYKYQQFVKQSGAQSSESHAEYLLKEERAELVRAWMDQLKEDCKKILLLSIFEEKPMKEIFPIMGYQNEQIARNKKHKCLTYLKRIVFKSVSEADILD